MKKITLLFLPLLLGLMAVAQDYKPPIPTVDDYSRLFGGMDAWQVDCLKEMEVDSGLAVDALLLMADNGRQWGRLLTQFHINHYQLRDPRDGEFHMGWARTWRRDLKKDAYTKTPGEHACLTFFSPKTATVLVLFPKSTADEERLLGFFLKRYENQAPRRLRRVEVVRDPGMPLGFRHVWLAPIVTWADWIHQFTQTPVE